MAYDSYGQNALAQYPPQDPNLKRNALLNALAPRQDFPGLGTPVPGPVASTLPVSTPAGGPPTSIAPTAPTAPAALPSGVTDPAKYNAIDFDKLGNRDYLNTQQGGAFWSDQLGPPPKGYVYNANGGLMKESGWDKFDKVMTDTTIAGLTGGLATAPLAAASIGGSIADVATSANVPKDQMGNPMVQGSAGAGAGTGTSALTDPASTAAGAAGTTGAGATLPANVDTNGYAKPGYVAPKPSTQPLAGYDSAKWNDTAHQSPKYAIGRILSQYPQTTDGLKAAMPEIIKAYPGAVQTGEDTISIPGVSTSVDVVKAGGGFWWGPETDASGNPYPKDAGSSSASSAGDTSGGYDSSGDVAGSDVIKKIIARLGGMVGTGGGVTSARDAVLNQLGIK